MAGNIIDLWGMSAMCGWRVSGKHTLGLMTDVNFECYLMRWLKTLAFHKFSFAKFGALMWLWLEPATSPIEIEQMPSYPSATCLEKWISETNFGMFNPFFTGGD